MWQGRLQLGDEPGVYGDASYSRLAAELPLTVQCLTPTQTADNKGVRVVQEIEGLQTSGTFPGHAIHVGYEPHPTVPFTLVERLLAQDVLKGSDNRKEVSATPQVCFVFLCVLIWTRALRLLYADVVWIHRSLLVTNRAFFASSGFPS